jgi:hypothetical protein
MLKLINIGEKQYLTDTNEGRTWEVLFSGGMLHHDELDDDEHDLVVKLQNSTEEFATWLRKNNHEVTEDKLNQFKTFTAWLKSTPRNEKDKISLHKIHITFKGMFDRFHDLLLINYGLQKGFLEKRYALKCRECNHTLKIIKVEKLFEELQDSDYCHCCESDIYYTIDNVEELYEYIGGGNQ